VKNKIIIVDRDKEFLKELEDMLEINGYVTVSFSKPSKALDKAIKLNPDLILFDIYLDGSKGIKYAEKIKYLAVDKKIPIIATTAFCENNECIKILKSTGIIECLTKPIKPIQIIKKIEKVLAVFKN
jgi:DNA-binding response OmpR family regulator